MNQSMTNRDLRSEIRETRPGTAKGVFFVHRGERQMSVHALHNISRAGLCLLLDAELYVEERVTIEYKTVTTQILVNAEVAWCRPSHEIMPTAVEDPGWLVGIRVNNPNLLLYLEQNR